MIKYNFLDKLSLNDLVNYYNTGDIIRLHVYNSHRPTNKSNPHSTKAVIIAKVIDSDSQFTRIMFTISIEGIESYAYIRIIYTNNISDSIDKIHDPIDLIEYMSIYGDGLLICTFRTFTGDASLDSYSMFKELIGADVIHRKCSNSKMHKENSISKYHKDNYLAKSKVKFVFKNLLITEDWIVIAIHDRFTESSRIPESINKVELRKFIDFLGGIIVDRTMSSEYALVPYTGFYQITKFYFNLNQGKRSKSPDESAFTEYNKFIEFRKSRVKALSDWRYKNKVKVYKFDKFPTEVYNNVNPY